MKITGITFELYDNYIWVIESDVNNEAWIVDPGESSKVVSYFQANNLVLAGILLTHHHYDHTWGIAEVIKQLGEVPVVSNSLGPFKGVTHHIGGGDKITVVGEEFTAIATPGHSHEHIAFYHPNALFCGDVLFTAGCGKAWCQSSAVMAESLFKIRALNDDCLIYCGHEYTLGNINFAAMAEPDNEDIRQRQVVVKERTAAGLACVPEKLGVEKKTNPFLRFDTEQLKTKLLARNELFENFSAEDNGNLYANLRAWKDNFDKD